MRNCPSATVYRSANRRPSPLKGVAALLLSFFLLGMLLTPLLELSTTWKEERNISTPNPVNLRLIQEEHWSALSPDARLEVLRGIAATEAEILGLPFPVTVKMATLESRVRGTYQSKNRLITLNQTFVCTGTAPEIVETLAHELYHAYQHCIVDLYLESEKYQRLMLFSDANAKEYCRELAEYQDGMEGEFDSYYQQQPEVDARAYAQRVRETYDRMWTH